MRRVLGRKVAGPEGAGADRDEVEVVEAVAGAPGRRHLGGCRKPPHLRRYPHSSSLRRTYKYASFLRSSDALHLSIFQQPPQPGFSGKLLGATDSCQTLPGRQHERSKIFCTHFAYGKKGEINLNEFSNLEVKVVGNDLEKAMRILKRKVQKDGIFRRLKAMRSYEKPSDCRRRKRRESERRQRIDRLKSDKHSGY
jgi:small subunit ribosomal protein S21